MSRPELVIVADTEERAIEYGARIHRVHRGTVLPLTSRADTYQLWGLRGVPLDIVPGTLVEGWHLLLEAHVARGHVRRTRTHLHAGTAPIIDELSTITDDLSLDPSSASIVPARDHWSDVGGVRHYYGAEAWLANHSVEIE